MPFLALAIICWIAAGCLGAGYLANLDKRLDANEDLSIALYHDTMGLKASARRLDGVEQRLDVVSTVADYAKDQSRLANKLAEGNAKTLQDHLDWVWAERAKREKAALGASKPRRKAHDRDR